MGSEPARPLLSLFCSSRGEIDSAGNRQQLTWAMDRLLAGGLNLRRILGLQRLRLNQVTSIQKRPNTSKTALMGSIHISPHQTSSSMKHKQELRMYFHGRLHDGRQRSRVALSKDGLHWRVVEPIIGYPYMRVFRHVGAWLALTMPGFFCRSADGLAPFDEYGPIIFGEGMRHSALLKRGDILHVFWSRIGDAPERILHTAINLNGDFRHWSAENRREFDEIHRPMHPWEGVNYPIEPSKGGSSMRPVHQLRDPAIFEEDGKIYLLYSLQGEQGIGIGELTFNGEHLIAGAS